jgi:hypothetical protein
LFERPAETYKARPTEVPKLSQEEKRPAMKMKTATQENDMPVPKKIVMTQQTDVLLSQNSFIQEDKDDAETQFVG